MICLRVSWVAGEVGQQLVEDAAGLARAYDVDVEAGEGVGPRFHGVGQAPALLHVAPQRRHQAAHVLLLGDALEQGQRLVDRYARFHQGGEAIGEVDQVGALDRLTRRLPVGARGGLELDRHQLARLQDGHRFAFGVGADLPALEVTLGIAGLVLIIVHTHIERVTLTTSSGVVSPWRSLSRASSRRVIMPSFTACWRIRLASAPLVIRWRTSSLMLSSS